MIDPESWGEMCVSFDKMLGEQQGYTEKYIESKSGSMCFQKLCVEKLDEE